MAKNPELNARRREKRRSDPEHRERVNDYNRNYQARMTADSEEFRGKRREYTRKYREENPHMAFYTTSRYQANKAGAFSDLTPEDARDIYELENVCVYCGKDCGESPSKRAIHIDHIIPMVQGGHNSRWNLVKSCISCNTSKGSSSLVDYFARCADFTQERYDAVVAQMSALSGKTADEITQLLEQSHAFEIAFQAERDRMTTLLAA